MASATGVVSYITVAPNLIQITGGATASINFGSVASPAIRTAYARGAAQFNLTLTPTFGARYNFSLATTLPPADSGSFQQYLFFTNSLATVQFSVYADESPVIQESLSGTSGSYTLVTNEVSATNTLAVNLDCSSHVTIGAIGSSPFVEVTRLVDFVFTMSVAQLTAGRTATQLLISWPVDLRGYVLERTTNLSNPTDWTEVSGGILISNGCHVLSVPFGNIDKAFYRLRR